MQALNVIFTRNPRFIRCVGLESHSFIIHEPFPHLIHRYTKHTGQDIRVSIRVATENRFAVNPIVLQILREHESPLKLPIELTWNRFYLIPMIIDPSPAHAYYPPKL